MIQSGAVHAQLSNLLHNHVFPTLSENQKGFSHNIRIHLKTEQEASHWYIQCQTFSKLTFYCIRFVLS